MFQFRSGAVVTLSPVEAKNLRGAAWAGSRPNAVTILDAGGNINAAEVPVATGDELVAAAYDVDPTDAILRLRRELKTEYSLSFVYRGFVGEPGEEERNEFAADTPRPLDVGSEVAIDGRSATVTAIEPGPHGFDGLLECDWATPQRP